MIRAKIVAEGNVQKVGYRDVVEDIAVKFGIKGFVENLKDKTVCVVCEAEKDVVDKFVENIKIKDDLIDVKSVKIVETLPATSEFKFFEIKYGKLEEEIGDRLVTGVKYAKLTLHETRGVGEKVEEVGRKVECVGEKVECVGEKVERVGEKVECVGEKVETVGGNIDNLTTQTNQHFTELKGSYHTFSERMLSMEEKLTQLVEYIGILVKNHIEKEEKGRGL